MKPKNFSQIENNVTIATVLKKFFNTILLGIIFKSILFGKFIKYNKRMEKIFYRVKNNENLLEIANHFKVGVFDIILQNNLIREIEPGDLLIINKTDGLTYNVKPSDTIESIAKKFCTTKEEILLKNRPLTYVFYGISIKI